VKKTEPQRTGRTQRLDLNDIRAQVIDAAMKVHSALGPGLLENVYEACLKYELEQRGLSVQQQVALPAIYEGTGVLQNGD